MTITKIMAKTMGYCNHCAAFYADAAHCGPGITDPDKACLCQLPEAVVARWKKDYGVEHKKVGVTCVMPKKRR
jgi:hypothetical protein